MTGAGDGTYALSYGALQRVHPAVYPASIRSQAEPPPEGPTFRGQCASLALEIASHGPQLQSTLGELCQALQSASDVHGELSGILAAIGAEEPRMDSAVPPPPPTEGAPRPSTRAPPAGSTTGQPSTPPPKELPEEIFLGNARSLSVPGPNLQAAQRLRQQLAGVVESGHEGTPVSDGRAESEGVSAAGGSRGGSGSLSTPSTLLSSTFFMPEFEGADPAFKDFVMSRLKYNYGERDLQDRMIVNWVRDPPPYERTAKLCSSLRDNTEIVAAVVSVGSAARQAWGRTSLAPDAHNVGRQLPAARLAAGHLGSARQANDRWAVIAARSHVQAPGHTRRFCPAAGAFPRRKRSPKHRSRLRVGRRPGGG